MVWQLWKLHEAKQTGHVKDSITLSWKIFLAISFRSSFLTNGKNYPLSNYLHWSFNPLRTSESSLLSQAEERSLAEALKDAVWAGVLYSKVKFGIIFMQTGGSKSSLQAIRRLSVEGVCVLAKCNSIPPRGLSIKVGNELFHFCKVRV